MTTEIVKLNPEVRPLIPSDYSTAIQLADVMFKSGTMPSSIKNKEAVFVAMQMGAGLGLTPMQAVQSIAVINGKPALYGDAMLAIVKASGLLEYIKEEVTGEGEKMVAKCIVKRKGEPEPVVREWSAAEAKAAGKWGGSGVWSQYPKRMLQMRPRSFALRDTFPDLLLGLTHTVEELKDGDMIDVTPSDPTPTVYDDPIVESTSKKERIIRFYGTEAIPSETVSVSELYQKIKEMRESISSPEEFKQHEDWWRYNYAMIKEYLIHLTKEEAKELSDIYFAKKKYYGDKPLASEA